MKRARNATLLSGFSFLWLVLAAALAQAVGGCGDGSGEEEDAVTEEMVEEEVVVEDNDEDGYPADEDCDDNNDAIYPGADEVCDGEDNDCDDETDEDPVDGETWYADGDDDGYGDDDDTVEACAEPDGYTDRGGDCDDDEENAFPGNTEVCDEIDNDCDDDIDEDDATDAATWYADGDEDGYGVDDDTVTACDQPEGYAAEGGDCDDEEEDAFPGNTEVCDDIDNDCDDVIDEDDAEDAPTWYGDSDEDGYGEDGDWVTACDQPEGYVADGGDCDDEEENAYPTNTEVCDEIDNDCDCEGDTNTDTVVCGVGDEGVDEPDAEDAPTWYEDGDEDTYGNEEVTLADCSQPEGYVANSDDCNDEDGDINPGAEEICDNEVDEDCDDNLNNGCPVYHCGNITEDETWSGEVLHVVTCDIYVQGAANPVLTIEDGARVEFDAGTDMYIGYNYGGKLVVSGDEEGVVFTASDTLPSPGDWRGVQISSNDNGSTLTGLTIEYAGANGYGGLYLYHSGPTLAGCTLRHSSTSGLYGAAAFPAISGSAFSDNNNDGAYLDGTSGLARDETPTFAANTATSNGGYGLTVPANYAGEIASDNLFAGNTTGGVRILADTVETSATWRTVDTPYIVSGDIYIQGGANPEVTIEDGNELQFDAGIDLYVGYNDDGMLTINGTDTGVVFTASDTPRNPGDWRGVQISSNDLGSTLTGLTIEYAGANGYGNLYLYHSAPTLAGCTVRHSSTHGVYGNNAYPAISGSAFSNNNDDGAYMDGSSGLSRGGTPTFATNTATSNGGYGLSVPANFVGEIASDCLFAGNTAGGVRVLADTVELSATWRTVDTPFVVSGDIYIQGTANPEVTIDDGNEFQFDLGIDLYVGYNDDGMLTVNGADTGVVFTASDTPPTPGDWRGVQISSNDLGSTLTGLAISYAGANGYGGLYLYHSSPTLSGCTVTHSSTDGVFGNTAFPHISGSTFSNNAEDGIYMDGSSGLDRTGTPSFASNTLTANGLYGMSVPAGYGSEVAATSLFAGNTAGGLNLTAGTVALSGTWRKLDVPTTVSGDVYVQGVSNPILTVEPGTTLQFDTGVDLYIGYNDDGGLMAVGTSESIITFTSSDISPANGDWRGIQLSANCIDASTVFDYTEVAFGGANGYGNLYWYHCDGSASNSTIRNSSTWGTYCNTSSPTLTSLAFSANTSGDSFGCP